ncbi:MAG: hypothetical protein LBM38_03670 [Clostridiales bacterium]|jgi:hypothetical protein|nr:hypothetical protein [Clostridiales bacterium]
MSKKLLFSLQNAYRNIVKTYVKLAVKIEKDDEYIVTGSGEWLLDNFYIIEEQVKGLNIELKNKEMKNLPTRVGLERVYHIAKDITTKNGKQFSENKVIEYIEEFQKREYLTDDEIFALPSMIKTACIIRIADFCKDLTTEKSTLEISNAIYILRKMGDINISGIFNKVSKTEDILSRDPSGIYQKMDDESKNIYRKRVQKLAKKAKVSAFDIASNCIATAQDRNLHIGEVLFKTQKTESNKKSYYPFTIIALSAILLFCVSMFKNPFILAACTLPVIDLSINITNFIFNKIITPRLLPKLDYSNGIPEDCATFVVIPALVTSVDEGKRLLNNLERYHNANRDRNLYFGLICDFPESSQSQDYSSYLKELNDYTISLNKKYGANKHALPKFYFMSRRAVFNPNSAKFGGYERKRGALIEFAKVLKGSTSTSFYPIAPLPKVRYIITLDSDTKLNMEVARKMVGIISHPMNRAIVDKKRKRVIRGYGIIQPRVATSLESTNKSKFAQIFGGCGVIDSYSGAISDTYQDIFGEGIFTGKGIIDIDAFLQVMQGKIEDNTVLSHDLLEGCYLKTGLATNVVLVDDFPGNYKVYSRRNHRWIRGDWQLLPFLRDKALNSISKWKIIDNLRRSINPIAFILLIICLASTPNIPAIAFCAIVLAIMFSHTIIAFIDYFKERLENKRPPLLYSDMVHGFKATFLQDIINFGALPYNAYMSLDAILRTLYRLFISHKKLLEWTTAAQTEVQSTSNKHQYFANMWANYVITIILIVFADAQSAHSLSAIIIGLFWIISPYTLKYLSKPNAIKSNEFSVAESSTSTRRKAKHTKHKHMLYQLSLRMYQYYEDFINEASNYLPPDNYQENPPNGVAMRTSPTNIGISLVAHMTAYDLGFISKIKLLQKLENTFSSIIKLNMWNGHLYNWYNIETLQPLRPMYVSTVDSGNFVSYLITLAEGLKTLAMQDNLYSENHDNGLKSIFNLCGMERDVTEITFETLAELELNSKDVAPAWSRLFRRTIADLRAAQKFQKDRITQLNKRLTELANFAQKLAERTDFRPLYNKRNHLFSIGFNVEQQELTNSYYDLLASEARTTSYIAVCNSQVPRKHWNALSRSMVTNNGYRGLVSWSGSAFEYFMPLLLLKNIPNTLLNETYSFVIAEQKKYARDRKIIGSTTRDPIWGVSESGFNTFDIQLNYQYKAFGIPTLGLSRHIIEDTVISPYSTIMALMIDYDSAIDNLERMNDEGFCGTYGFYESIDFTPKRTLGDEKYAIVKSYMVHHLGMSLLALDNVLCDNIMQKRFLSNTTMQIGEELLAEKVPTNSVLTKDYKAKIRPLSLKFNTVVDYVRNNVTEGVHVLSNGRFHSIFDAQGNGWQMCEDTMLTNERIGNYVYVKNRKNNEVFSASPSPCFDSKSLYSVNFNPSLVEIIRNGKDCIDVTTKIFVDSEKKAEVTCVHIANNSDETVQLDVAFYSESVLAAPMAHYSHMTFSKLFVETEKIEDCVISYRRPRAEGAPDGYMLNVNRVFGSQPSFSKTTTARQDFLGRLEHYSQPFGVTQGINQQTFGAVLDPIVAHSHSITIPRGEHVDILSVIAFDKTKNGVISVANKYVSMEAFKTAMSVSVERAKLENRYLNVHENSIKLAFELLQNCVLGHDAHNYKQAKPTNLNYSQTNLWAYGISGDNPICCFTVRGEESLERALEVVQAHKFLTYKGIKLDLILMSYDGGDYRQTLNNGLRELVSKQEDGGNVYILSTANMSEKEKELILLCSYNI